MEIIGTGGPRSIEGQRDEEGHRTYTVVFRVAGAIGEGPANAMRCPGLPVIGAPYIVGTDVDLWAWRRPTTRVTKVLTEGDPDAIYDVEITFSSKPAPPQMQRCNDTEIEDPLLEPQKVSGSFVKFTEEFAYDRFGVQIVNSAWEPMKGPQTEFDRNRPSVRIEQNVPLLQLELISSLIDYVNDGPMWGLPARCVKLSGISWERKFYGSCYVYFTRTFDFDINYETFDRDLLDEGTKVLRGHWDRTANTWVTERINGLLPDNQNPAHFVRFKDFNGENARILLNGLGLPANTTISIGSGTGDLAGTGTYGSGSIGSIHVEAYQEGNLFVLGIPTTLGIS